MLCDVITWYYRDTNFYAASVVAILAALSNRHIMILANRTVISAVKLFQNRLLPTDQATVSYKHYSTIFRAFLFLFWYCDNPVI